MIFLCNGSSFVPAYVPICLFASAVVTPDYQATDSADVGTSLRCVATRRTRRSLFGHQGPDGDSIGPLQRLLPVHDVQSMMPSFLCLVSYLP